MEAEDLIELKIVLVGNAAVGKTSIINRIIKKTFNEFNPSTVGAMFLTYLLEVDGKTYKLQIWDTAGQERLRAIAPLYYRDAHGVILVYDITARDSFEGLNSWFNDLQDKGSERTSTIVIGNKIDLNEEQQVDFETADNFVKKKQSALITASAKDGRGIEEAFCELVRRIVAQQFNGTGNAFADEGRTRIDRKTFYDSKKKATSGKKGCC